MINGGSKRLPYGERDIEDAVPYEKEIFEGLRGPFWGSAGLFYVGSN